MIRNTLLLVLPLALVACGDPEPATEQQATATPSTNPSIEQFGDAKLVVDANGVGAKGSPMQFGAERAAVDAALEKAFGAPPEKSSNAECGAGPMEFSQFGPLQVGYQEGKLAGWFLKQGQGVVTSDGVKPGTTTLGALKSERQVQQIDTTLEGEFQYTTADFGTITGFAAPDGAITGLAAGVTCFFR